MVVTNKVFGHDLRIDVEVGEAEHLGFIVHLVALQDAAAGEHGATFAVFYKKVHSRDVIEDAVEMIRRIELC